MDASGRGDDRRQESVTQSWSRVALPIFINLRLCPLREHEVKVLMAQGAIQREVISAAMKVVNCFTVEMSTVTRRRVMQRVPTLMSKENMTAT